MSTYFNIYVTEEFEKDGEAKTRWNRVGSAFPHEKGQGGSAAVERPARPKRRERGDIQDQKAAAESFSAGKVSPYQSELRSKKQFTWFCGK